MLNKQLTSPPLSSEQIYLSIFCAHIASGKTREDVIRFSIISEADFLAEFHGKSSKDTPKQEKKNKSKLSQAMVRK